MTLLLGGSILLIAGSAVALVMGWLNAEETYIWGSIAATAAAAALLFIAFFRSRATAPPVPAGGVESRGAEIDKEILADREERSKQKYARASTRGSDAASSGDETQVLAPDAPPPDGPAAEAAAPTAATVGPPAGGDQDTKAIDEQSDAGTQPVPGAGGAKPPAETVVGVPKTKKFHRPECRFASAKNTESLSRADATGRGFEPCGTCKP